MHEDRKKTKPRAVRLLHTADLHLGRPFHNFAGDRGAKLRETRLEALDRIGDLARRESVDLVLVAGDLFDSNTVDDRTVAAACARIKAAGVLFAVIPGNHDACAGPDSVYRRSSFRSAAPGNLVVLVEPRARAFLDGRLVLLPAPCLYRRSVTDTTAHFTEVLCRDIAPDAVRIGLAHGSVIGFERDDEGVSSNLIPAEKARSAGLDYLALGDWHGTKEVDERTWYSGTPEPTSFKGNDQGNVLIVTVEAPGVRPQVERHVLGRTTFVSREYELFGPDDVSRMAADLDSLQGSLDTVLELIVRGDLPSSVAERARQIVQGCDGRFLGVLTRLDELRERVLEADLANIASDGFVRVAAERLLQQSRMDSEQRGAAMLALRLLHRFATDLGGASC